MSLRAVWPRAMEYLGLGAATEAQSLATTWVPDAVVHEYLVVDDPASGGELQAALNAVAQDGWRVRHVVPSAQRSARVVLERAVVAAGVDPTSPDEPLEWPPPPGR